MTTRDHNNRSEKRKGHTASGDKSGAGGGHKGASEGNKGGGDGAGGGSGKQGQGQAKNPSKGQQSGHG